MTEQPGPEGSPATSEVRADRAVRVMLILGILAPLAPFLFLSSRAISLTDDAYYYLLPAANFWKLGFYSFDALTGTNGFHPLWMLLVTAMALPLHLAGATDGLPRAVLGLSIVQSIWGSVTWFGVLRRGGLSRPLAALMVLVTVLSCQDLLLSGLETVAVFWSLSLLAGYLLRQVQASAPIAPGWLAGYSLLVLFSRLDCGLLLIMLYGLLAFYTGPRRIVLAGFLLCALAAPYLALNVVYHGAATPISGRVKQHWGDRYELETAGRTFGLSWAQVTHGPGKKRLNQIIGTYVPRDIAPTLKTVMLDRFDVQDKHPAWALGILLTGLSLAALRWGRALRRGIAPPARFLALFSSLLVLFYIVSTLYYALTYDRVWPWYGAVGVMVMAAGFTFLAGNLLERPRLKYVPLLLMAGLLIHGTVANIRALENRERNFSSSLRSVYLDLAAWLASNTPKDAVAAGWAVGEIGWHAQRPVINLEGLVGDQAMLEANQATDLLPLLARHNVTYLSNFWRPSLAPRPEELLAPTASDGAWKGGPIRYFWTLRLRPMMDCPEAFSVLHRHDAGDAQDTSGYVLGVDPSIVKDFLVKREDWRTRLAACATVIPAEGYEALRAGQMEGQIRRSEGYFIRGADLRYSVNGIEEGNYGLYGRVCSLASGEGSITITQEDSKQKAVIPGVPQWRHVRLGNIAVAEDEEREAEWRITTMSRDVYLDQLYLVRPEAQATFEAVAADWWGPGE